MGKYYYNNKSQYKQSSGLKEVFLFISFVCLIFCFLVSAEIGTTDLFLKILNIVLLCVLSLIGISTGIKSLVDSFKNQSKVMIVLNIALLLVYLTLIIKIVYLFK